MADEAVTMLPEEEKNRIEPATLYLVATPIGNLADLSDRAKKVLNGVDFIAAEDTRNTRRLLAAVGVSKPLVSYHEHNKKERGSVIADRLAAGESCALVTDAGTPAVSDPGEDLVVLCAERGIHVTSVPGCSALITALILSALPTGKFCFEGFLPAERGEKTARLAELATERRTIVFYEAPHRLAATLAAMCEAFGTGRRVSLCRELTKRNEEIDRTTFGAAIEKLQTTPPRGEYVLVVEGFRGEIAAEKSALADLLTPAEHVAYHEKRGLSHADALRAAAAERSLRKNDLYRLLEQQKN